MKKSYYSRCNICDFSGSSNSIFNSSLPDCKRWWSPRYQEWRCEQCSNKSTVEKHFNKDDIEWNDRFILDEEE